LKLLDEGGVVIQHPAVAFTPKGGCPLKPHPVVACCDAERECSIHPQGWVPIETRSVMLAPPA